MNVSDKAWALISKVAAEQNAKLPGLPPIKVVADISDQDAEFLRKLFAKGARS
jgi:hypothetical protein